MNTLDAPTPSAIAHVRPPTFDVLGTRVSAVQMEGALRSLETMVREDRREFVCVCSVHMVMSARKDAALRRALDSAALVVPDGFPLARVGRRRTPVPVSQVRGTDFLVQASEQAARLGHAFYFYGGAPGVAEEVAKELTQRFPGLRVAGTFCPPFRPLGEREDADVVRAINGANPDVVWVGLGCPKQEKWMMEHRQRLHAAALVGVGAAFDFISGRKGEAPRFVQSVGLEWLWRLVHEPRRLWRRVFVDGFAFVALLFGQYLLGGRAGAGIRPPR